MNLSSGGSGTISPDDRGLPNQPAPEYINHATVPPVSTSLLATVHEDKELVTTRDEHKLLTDVPVGLPMIHSLPTSSTFPPLTKDMLIMTQKRRAHDVRPRTETFAAG